jgi:hypothetical protein
MLRALSSRAAFGTTIPDSNGGGFHKGQIDPSLGIRQTRATSPCPLYPLQSETRELVDPGAPWRVRPESGFYSRKI